MSLAREEDSPSLGSLFAHKVTHEVDDSIISNVKRRAWLSHNRALLRICYEYDYVMTNWWLLCT